TERPAAPQIGLPLLLATRGAVETPDKGGHADQKRGPEKQGRMRELTHRARQRGAHKCVPPLRPGHEFLGDRKWCCCCWPVVLAGEDAHVPPLSEDSALAASANGARICRRVIRRGSASSTCNSAPPGWRTISPRVGTRPSKV